MNDKVLILGVAAVQLDAILEVKKLGYETFACAMAKDGPGADAADHFDIINILNEEAIEKHIQKNGISLVYSVGSDLAIPIASSISERLNLPHFVSEKTAKTCNNKNLMRNALGQDFKGNLMFQSFDRRSEQVKLDFPFILKPSDSQGQRGVVLVNNSEDFSASFDSVKSYSRSGLVMIEQYIGGREISVNGYIVNGEIKYLIASDRVTWPEFVGLIHEHQVPAKDLSNKTMNEIMEIVEKACKKLEILNGPVYLQMKVENGIPYILEITPRLDGCHMWKVLTYYSGVNLLKLTFEHLLNNDTRELKNQFDKFTDKYVLEFMCQEPNTKAYYSMHNKEIAESIINFNYYQQGEVIRPVNGKFEKIGYCIFKRS